MGGKLGSGKMITREEVEMIAFDVSLWLGVKPLICGSYRRGKELMGDVDLVIPYPRENFEEALIQRWGKHKNGNPKRSGLVHGVQVDLMFIESKDALPAAVLASTGSGEFNRAMRSVAKKQGYKLNEKGLWDRDTGERIPTRDEESIFVILKLEWVPPATRSGFGEVNRAVVKEEV